MLHAPEDDEARACGICGRILAQIEGVGYRHVEQDIALGMDDHIAVPVRYVELGENLRLRCDFCSAESPTYVVYSATIATPEIDSVWDSEWAACDDCAELVMTNRWGRLVQRAVATFVRDFGGVPTDEAIFGMRVLVHTVHKNMTSIEKV